jgi:hypothetical protein
MKKYLLLAAILLCGSVAHATTYPAFLGQFNNETTATCNDQRVSRGIALVATAQYPNGTWVPGIGFNCGGGPWNPYYTPCTNLIVTLKKNGSPWNGEGTLKPTDTLIQTDHYTGGVSPGNHVMIISNMNPLKNEVCINPDGTSCGAVFKVDGVAICY